MTRETRNYILSIKTEVKPSPLRARKHCSKLARQIISSMGLSPDLNKPSGIDMYAPNGTGYSASADIFFQSKRTPEQLKRRIPEQYSRSNTATLREFGQD